jgi:nucleoside-diphosphate-sugar epimerase
MNSCLILGGNRFVGVNLVRQLLDRGNRVAVFNRGHKQLVADLASQVQIIQGDRNIRTDLEKAAAFDADIVFDMSCYEPSQAQMAVEIFGGRIHRYLYVSSVAAYRTPLTFPVVEDDPLGTWPLWGPYGPQKAATDTFFLDAYGKTRFPVTILRPTYVLGPGNHVEREAFFVSRLLQKMPIVIPGDGQALIHFIFASEVAQALIALSETPGTVGQAYNAATDQAITLERFVRLIAEILGAEAQLIYADPETFHISNEPYQANLLSPFANSHVVIANQKLKAICGLTFEPVETRLAATIPWFVENHQKLSVTSRSVEREVLAYFGF